MCSVQCSLFNVLCVVCSVEKYFMGESRRRCGDWILSTGGKYENWPWKNFFLFKDINSDLSTIFSNKLRFSIKHLKSVGIHEKVSGYSISDDMIWYEMMDNYSALKRRGTFLKVIVFQAYSDASMVLLGTNHFHIFFSETYVPPLNTANLFIEIK